MLENLKTGFALTGSFSQMISITFISLPNTFIMLSVLSDYHHSLYYHNSLIMSIGKLKMFNKLF